jgi:peptidoglycan/xylan/chitin deacetylase (PgdA/CDA1 family)
MRCRLLAVSAAVVALQLSGFEARGAASAVVLMYHHVDGDTPPSTSISPAVFGEQLEFLEREGFNVIALIDLLDALDAGRPVPERSVAITFDDAYRSVLTEALPLLEARGWPFTVFVSTEAIDAGYGGFLSWDELRRLGDHGATFGNHSVSHTHLVRRETDETEGAWLRRITAEITAAAARLEDEVGAGLIPAFAYPYGEYTVEVKAIVEAQGLYGLGQQSGPIGSGSDFYALPRFPVATGLEMADFALRVRTLPLPVRLVGSERHIVDSADDRPVLTLAVDSNTDVRLDQLACYASGQSAMAVEWQNGEMRQFTARPARAFGPGRSKVNCTAPSRANSGTYYWYGHLWMRPRSDGRWYDE